jgi:hypothetical protein
LILTRKQKELLVIKLAKEGRSTRQIAEVAHVSLKDIGTIIRRYTGEAATTDPETDKSLSANSKAFKLFRENKDLVDVSNTLDIEADEVLALHTDYLRLNMDKLMCIYREMGDEIPSLEHLYIELKWHGLANSKDISNIMQKEEKLKNMDRVLF